MIKRNLLGTFILATVVAGSTSSAITAQATQNYTIKYEANDWNTISNEDPSQFDNPPVGPNGILERMPTTYLQTKYGKMEVIQLEHGYETKNLTNPNAPILYTGTVNNIYKVNGSVDLNALLTPKIMNANGQEENGTIIFPNVDTSKANFGAKYIEAIDANGNITIAPFIYNTVDFKTSLHINNEDELKNISLAQILNGPTTNLKPYIANYEKGSNKIIVGVSRGMASTRQEMDLTIGNEKPKVITKDITNQDVNKAGNISSATNQAPPTLIKILISKWTYIIVGIILISIISFFSFRKKD